MARKSRPSGKHRPQPNAKSRVQEVEPKPTIRGWYSYILLALTLALILGSIVTAVGRGGDNGQAQNVARITKTPDQAVIHLANHQYRTDGPRTLAQLLALPDEKLEQLDIALINLLCAEGLPGAGDIDIDGTLATLDRWAAYVERETDRHLYKLYQNPDDWDHSEARFRMGMLITVLQLDCGVHYNLDRVREVDFTHSEDLFLHGMVRPGMKPILEVEDPAGAQALRDSTNGGTCVSMPVVYTAIARRLGYPVTLSTTQAHVFCRWDGRGHANPMYRDYFNIEGAS